MSMLTFYQNRAGRNLSAAKKRVLDKAKDELRKLYSRGPYITAPARAGDTPRA